MRILQVVPTSLASVDSGFKRLCLDTLAALRQSGHETTTLECNLRPVIASSVKSPATSHRSKLLTLVNWNVLRFNFSPTYTVQAVRLGARFRPDIVQAEGFWSFPIAQLAGRGCRPVLVRDHNLPSIPSNPYNPTMRRLGAVFVKAARAAGVFVATPTQLELEELLGQGWRSERVFVLPHGVSVPIDTHPGETDGQRSAGGHRIVFVGDFSWKPNREAAELIGNQIAPLVREVVSDAEFIMVGSGETASLRKEGLTFLGRVDNLQAILHDASVAIAPLWSGGGMSIKTLEYLASGVPLVSTSWGIRGMPEIEDGKHALLADDSVSFAKEVIEVLRDESLAKCLARNGRSLVSSRYSLSVMIARLEGIYHSIREQW